MKLRWITILFLISFCQLAFSQGGSVRIAVYGGGSVDFVFNSLSDYNTGLTYTNWTLLGLEVIDDVALPDYTTWSLTAEIDDADLDGAITGTNAVNTIPFSSIEVSASVSAGCATCNFFGSPFVGLAAAPVTLVDGSSAPGWPPDQVPPNLLTTADQVNISYRCGVPPNGLMGESADYYSDDIVFTLEMDP